LGHRCRNGVARNCARCCDYGVGRVRILRVDRTAHFYG
jgi:hypothetical protein